MNEKKPEPKPSYRYHFHTAVLFVNSQVFVFDLPSVPILLNPFRRLYGVQTTVSGCVSLQSSQIIGSSTSKQPPTAAESVSKIIAFDNKFMGILGKERTHEQAAQLESALEHNHAGAVRDTIYEDIADGEVAGDTAKYALKSLRFRLGFDLLDTYLPFGKTQFEVPFSVGCPFSGVSKCLQSEIVGCYPGIALRHVLLPKCPIIMSQC